MPLLTVWDQADALPTGLSRLGSVYLIYSDFSVYYSRVRPLITILEKTMGATPER